MPLNARLPSPAPAEPPAVDEPHRNLLAANLISTGCLHEGEQEWEAAIAFYQEAVDLEPWHASVRYFAHNNLAFCLIQLGRYDEAEEHCEAAIFVDRERHNAHKNLGLVRYGQGRWLDAALSLAEAARLRLIDTRAWCHLQKLLAAHPGLMGQSPELAAAVAQLKRHYEVESPSPRLH